MPSQWSLSYCGYKPFRRPYHFGSSRARLAEYLGYETAARVTGRNGTVQYSARKYVDPKAIARLKEAQRNANRKEHRK